MNEQLNSQLGTSYEQYLKCKQAITEKYNQKASAIETENAQSQMTILSYSAGSLGTILDGNENPGSTSLCTNYSIPG
ncbi:hypothetical protein C1Y42_18595 [Pantoea sp. ICBG 985]|nr:hypothetical protein C1Y42_18595 [Pantoea sp. ICBG 985]